MEIKSSPSALRLVLIGHLWITLPVLAIMASVAAMFRVLLGPPDARVMGMSGLMVHTLRLPLGLIVGAAVAWVWWSFAVPRWRAWAASQEADANATQSWAERTLLVWPKGSKFESTEFRRRRQP